MSDQNKKTLLTTIDFPPQVGGVARYYFNLVSKNPEQFLVLTNNLKTGDSDQETNLKIIRKNLFTKYCWPHWLPIIFHLFQVLKKENIKQVWVGQILPVGTAVFLISKIKKIEYFVTCHGNDLLRAKQNKRKFWLSGKILKNAEHIEAANELTRDILTNDFGIKKEKINIVWPKLSLDKNNIDQQKILDIKNKFNLENKKVLLTVSRLVASKNIDKVLNEFKNAVEQDDTWSYLIVGDGPEKENLREKISELGLVEKVFLVGQVDPQEIVNYYQLADKFILTPGENEAGDTESFGIVFLEAKSFRLPIATTDFGGIAEAIGDYDLVTWIREKNDIKKFINNI
jgi:phosphatidyl-myo-inositol dimannoside synthase